MTHLLKAVNIGKIYDGRRVVREVSFEVNRGEVVGLMGPNGAGKTSCFYIVMGLIMPDHGNVILDDVDITTLPIHQRARLGLGYLPQESSVFRGLTVEENIMAALEVRGYDYSSRLEKLEELLAAFAISHIRTAPAAALSGGERRRVEIARCLATNPKYILLDEPLAGIDPIATSEIQKMIRELKGRGIGVLITDHNVRAALEVIDRGYVIYDGMVMSQGSPAEILQSDIARKVYFGEDMPYQSNTGANDAV
ncbi:MAG: LPS export ABC transporter ATP-binding protein [Proteobacteria bacterium]|nr:LPS export ABC transporter ATP-binding protein [Pseudomonadota bacterium]